ncbi:MAG TPA: acetate--CoA ligase family protein [Acidobacteriaceae bacterium]|jgi:acyl-CoA synthetase (NDP forming)|nr:acetate--CoA ligase family protein [Acidobacteriaceae bacterium]
MSRWSRTSIDRLLSPRSVAIVGASATPGALGESLLTNLERAQYGGAIHLINPKRSEIRGRACLASIDELPEGVDCAVLAIPRAGVLEGAGACARKRVGAVIVYSAGFAESGIEGRDDQEKLRRIAVDSGMVIEGPNCLGMVNYAAGIPLTFVMTATGSANGEAPGVGVISQSGALAAVLAVNLQHHGMPITYSISTGNEAATGVEDFVEYLLDDEGTRVITMIVEQFREPPRFLALARRARAAGKFVVLLHPGRSEAARASAATHTGAMITSYAVMRTLVADAGVALVDSLELLADVTQIVLRCSSLPGGGAAVLTESGAFKALALDLCEEVHLPLPVPEANTAARLSAVLPKFIAPANPLDITAHALVDPDLYRRTLGPILEDPGYGSLVLSIILTDEATSDLKFPPILEAIRTIHTEKPVLFAALDEGARCPAHWVEEVRSLGIPFFPSPERAFRALAAVTDLTRRKARPAPADAGAIHIPDLAPGTIPEYRSKRVFAELGIPVPAGSLARDCDEACSIAKDLGYPVALKAQASALSHKSDSDGVILHIRSDEDLVEGWRRLQSHIARAHPPIHLEGVLVECMAARGVELIVGVRREPGWGPVLLAGAGGVLAEVLGDEAALMPGDLPIEAIEHELRRMKSGRLLRGFRGSGAADVRSAAAVLARLGEIMRSMPAVREIEINPLVVYPEGQGCLALDGLIVIAGPASEP